MWEGELSVRYTTCSVNASFGIFHMPSILLFKSRDSAVGIATGYGLDGRGVGVRVPVRSRMFCSPCPPDRLWEPTEPPIQLVPGALSTEVKRPGREAGHSPPTNVEVKKTWIYTSIPPYAFIAWCLIS
jgi:hypothetical protein